jgi:hypothetical protein
LSATDGLAEAIKSAISPALVYGNGIGTGDKYFNHGTDRLLHGLDGVIAEVFMRTGYQSLNTYRTEAKWRLDVDMLADASANGDSVLVVTKTWASGTDAKKESIHRYALASFMLGDGGTNQFVFLKNEGDSVTTWRSLWDTDLGAPLGSYYKNNGLYVRDFVNGKVVVNPTSDTRSINLGGSYRLSNGNIRTSLTLQPHTADILSEP